VKDVGVLKSVKRESVEIPKFVEIEKGVFRDPSMVYIRASDGAHIKYSADADL
jgi:hypothetical protein